MKLLKLLFLFLWQLPQNIVGAFCIFKYNNYDIKFSSKGEPIEIYYKKWFGSGVSLGDIVILDNKYYKPDRYSKIVMDTIRHEHGHQIQSRILGPLYLPIIGLLSLLGNIVFRIFKIKSKYYYKLPWEWWADKLGGVKRE